LEDILVNGKTTSGLKLGLALLMGLCLMATALLLVSGDASAGPASAPPPVEAAREIADAAVALAPASAPAPDRWYDPGWRYRRPVTISHPCSETLSTYQVEITLDASFDFENTQPGGEDLRVTDSDGQTPLPFWIEQWNRIQQRGTVWVRVPTSSSTVFLYYGNPDPPDTPLVESPPIGPWTKHASNPIVPIGDPGTGDSLLAENVVSDTETGHYWLVFANYRDRSVGLAWSDDPGDPTAWHWHGSVIEDANAPHLIEHDGTWHIFYADKSPTSSPYPISVATADVVSGTYTYHSTVLTSTEMWEAYRVDEPYVFQRGDGTWVMLYMGDQGDTTERIGYATAPSLLGPYTKFAGNPTIDFGPAGSIDAGTVADPWAVEFQGVAYIGYTVSPTKHHPWRTSYVTTSNWITFSKSYEIILDLGSPGAWDEDNAFRGAVTRFGDIYYFPYTGATADPYVYRMGLATQPVFLPEPINDPHQVFDFYDPFAGDALDTARWTVGYELEGGTVSVGDGVLTVTGQSSTTSGYVQLWGTPSVGTGTLLEARGRHLDAGLNAGPEETNTAGEVGYKLGADWDEVIRMMDYPDLTRYTVQANANGETSGYVTTTLPFDAEWHTYRIHRTLSDTVIFQIDDNLLEELGPPYVPTADMPPWLMSYARQPAAESRFVVDWIRARQWCGAEAPATVGAQEQGLFIGKAASADPVEVGDQLVYTITYRSATSDTFTGLAITDTLDANVELVAASPPPDGGTSVTPTWSLDPISGPTTGTIVLTTTVASPLPNGTILTNAVTLSSAETGPLSTWITTAVAAPTLGITQTDAPDPVVAGETLVYTLTYANRGDAEATTVVITDVLDEDVTFAGARPAPTGGTGQTRTWEIATLAPLTSHQIIVSATVQGNLGADGTLSNSVTIASQQTGPQTVIETTEVLSHTTAASIALAPATAAISAGQSISYALTAQDVFANEWDVTGSGAYTLPAAAGGAWLTNVYTAEVAGAWTVTAVYEGLTTTAALTVEPGPAHSLAIRPEAAAIAPGESQAYTAEAFDRFANSRGDVTAGTGFAIVEAGHGGSWVDNVYTAQNFGTWTVRGTYGVLTDEVTLTVLDTLLSLEKSDGITTAHAGDWLTYTLIYANTGNEDALDVVITDTLPAYTEFHSCTPASGVDCEHLSPDRVVLHVPTIAAGTQDQAEIVVTVDDALPAGVTALTNTAVLTAPALPAPLEAWDVDQMGTLPDLVIAVDHAPSLFIPGGEMTYTVSYGNVGDMDATGVEITATLPVSSSYVGAGWTTSDGQTYTYDAGDLPAGETGHSATFVVTYPEQAQIDQSEIGATFAIFETGSGGADAVPLDNTAPVLIGVPDLVVRHFAVEPVPLVAGAPMTFTVVIENQGTGPAWNPSGLGGFHVDVFTSAIASYPCEEYGFAFGSPPALMPGAQYTQVFTHAGLTLEQLAEIVEGFYVRVDNDISHPYGLVPESDEWNNVAGPLSIWSHSTYLPLVSRR
jgi:uncharacterized repeat protein (TIGR01451 family)